MPQDSSMNTVRGLGIANTIIAAISLVIDICVVVFMGIIVAGLADPEIQSEIMDALSKSGSYTSSSGAYVYSSSLSETDYALIQGFVGVLLFIVIWFVIMTILCLVAGIIEVRNARNPQKLGGVFGWSIVGAVCSFLGGSFAWINTILYVIAAVYANKAKNAAAMAASFATPQGFAGGSQGYIPQGGPVVSNDTSQVVTGAVSGVEPQATMGAAPNSETQR